MRIKQYKGYGSYAQSIFQYSKTTSAYMFAIEKTGETSEEDQEEYSYLLYEFPSAIPLKDTRNAFVSDYLDYIGYTKDAQLQIMAQSGVMSTDKLSALQYAELQAMKYADFIYNPKTADYAREKKNLEVNAYYNSGEVNGMQIGGIELWLDPTLRGNIQRQLWAAEIKKEESITTSIAGMELNLPLAQASLMLAELEQYAAACYNNRDKKLADIKKLTSVVEINAFDATGGYPEKLKFELQL